MNLLVVAVVLIAAVICAFSDRCQCFMALAIAFGYVLFSLLPVERFDTGDAVSDFIVRQTENANWVTPFPITTPSPPPELISIIARETGEEMPLSPFNDGYDVDSGLAERQRYLAGKNKRAIDGMVQHGRDYYGQFFKNELDENQRRVWYSAEASPVETDFWAFN